MVDKRLLFLFGVVLVAALPLCNADGHAEDEDEEKDMTNPYLALTAMVSSGPKNAKLTLKQAWDDGKWGVAKASFDMEGLSGPEILVADIAAADCTEAGIAALTDKVNLTDFFTEKMAPAEAPSRKRRSADEEPAMEDMFEEIDLTWGIKKVNLPDYFGKKVIIKDGADVMCQELSIVESETTVVILFRWSASSSVPIEKLIETIQEETGIPEGAILEASASRDVTADGITCKEVKLAFVGNFGPELLRKLYRTLTSETCLGFFSVTDTCFTNVRDSAFGKLIVKAFLEKNDVCPKADYPFMAKEQCSNSVIAEKYQKMYSVWMASFKAYTKKYNIEVPGLDMGEDMPEVDWNDVGMGGSRDNGGRQDSGRDDMGDSDTAQQLRYLKFISNFLCMPEPDDMEDDKKRVDELLKMNNQEALQKLVEKIQEKTAEREDRDKKTHYAACMLSHAGDMKEKLLASYKQRLCAADAGDWGMEGDKILTEMVVSDVKNILKYSSAKDLIARVGSHSSKRSQTIRKKLMLIFAPEESTYSTEHGRRRTLKKLAYIPDMLEGILEALGSEKHMRILKEKLSDEDAKKTLVKKLFYFLYNPDAEFEDDLLVGVFNVTVDDIDELKPNFTKLLDRAAEESDTDLLLLIHIVLLKESDLETGCSLKDLAVTARRMMREASGGNDYRGSVRGDWSMGDRSGWGGMGGGYGGGYGWGMGGGNAMQFGPRQYLGGYGYMPPANRWSAGFGGMQGTYGGGRGGAGGYGQGGYGRMQQGWSSGRGDWSGQGMGNGFRGYDPDCDEEGNSFRGWS